MRNRLLLQQNRPYQQETDGSDIPNWVTLTTNGNRSDVAAQVCEATSRELWQARQVQSDVTHAIKARYAAKLSDLTGSVRGILRTGDTAKGMHLKGSINTGERNRELVLTFSEAADASRLMQDPTGDPLFDTQGDWLPEP